MGKYKKVLLICPNFENEHLCFEKFFTSLGLSVTTILFNENEFLRNFKFYRFFIIKMIKFIILFFIKKIIPSESYKSILFNRKEFNNFLVKSTDNFVDSNTLVFFVKPYILNNGEFLKKINSKTDGLFFYTYDSFRRFPISKEIYSKKFITFDIEDALSRSWSYSPIPREDSDFATKEKRKAFVFYGVFSKYRLIRILIASYLFRSNNIKTQFYLMHPILKSNFKLFGIYFGGKRRTLRTNYISIDIPQNNQSGGSIRSKNPHELCFSYSHSVPHWRFIEVDNLLRYIKSINKIINLIKTKNINQMYYEENLCSYKALKISIENLSKQRWMDSDPPAKTAS